MSMREPQNMLVGLAAMLVTLLVGAGCAPIGKLPPKADGITEAGHYMADVQNGTKTAHELFDEIEKASR